MTRLSLVYVSNELHVGHHPDVHAALRFGCDLGTLAQYRVISHPAIVREQGSGADVVREVSAAVEEIGANVVVWSHTGTLAVSAEALRSLRQRLGAMMLLDGDWYQPPYKPFPREAEMIAGACDLAFVPGEGWFSQRLRSLGVETVTYFPQTSDSRFESADGPPSTLDFDVVMIGNRVRSRLPGRTMPGAKWRESLVRAFTKRFGKRFGVFGSGWSGGSAQGPVPFCMQSTVLQSSIVSLGVNNLHARYYFSNRLPISMASGRLTLYNEEAGLRSIIPEGLAVEWYSTTEQALSTAQRAIDGLIPNDFSATRRFTSSYLSMTPAMQYLLACAQSLLEGGCLPVNPWTGHHLGGRS